MAYINSSDFPNLNCPWDQNCQIASLQCTTTCRYGGLGGEGSRGWFDKSKYNYQIVCNHPKNIERLESLKPHMYPESIVDISTFL